MSLLVRLSIVKRRGVVVVLSEPLQRIDKDLVRCLGCGPFRECLGAVDCPFEHGPLVAVVGSYEPLLTVVVVDSDQLVVEIEFEIGH